MHPNRWKMIEIALEILPFDERSPLSALEIGGGTGTFTRAFLERFPSSRVVCIDGSASMMELAKSRLSDLVKRVEFRFSDFRMLRNVVPPKHEFQVVFSSYALHHLDRREKRSVVEQALHFLEPNGWFVNADIIIGDNQELEDIFQRRRISRILEGAGEYERFRDLQSTREFLDALEANEGDQPMTLREDLQILQELGLRNVSAFWQEYREAVFGGVK